MEANVKQKGHITISAVVTRVDGSVEDLGVIAEGDGEAPQGLFDQVKQAWKDGWDEGRNRKDKT